MEAENAKSDLLSLRKLYGLLRRSADDVRTARNGFQLDERALLLLKSLLDSALEKLLQAHPKGFVAPNSGVCDLGFSPKSHQSMAVPKLQPPSSPNESNASLHFTTNHSNCHALPAFRDKHYFLDKQTPADVLSLMSISSNKWGNGTKDWEESQTKQQKPGKILSQNTNALHCLENETLHHLLSSRDKKSTGCSAACSSSSRKATGFVAEKISSDAESNCLLKQVANAIDRIEFQISALQLCSDRALSSSDIPVIQKEQGIVKSHFADSVPNKSKVVSRQTSYIKNELVRQRVNEANSQYVHGLRLPPCPNDQPHRRPPLPFTRSSPAHNQTAGKDTRGIMMKSRPQSTISSGPTGRVQNQRIPRPMIRPIAPRPKFLTYHQGSSEEDTTTTASSTPRSSSSSWTSRQTSLSDRDSDSTESASRKSADASQPSSSGSEERSFSDESRRSRRDKAPTQANRSSAQIGRLRRLKNKLGFIFHHHHHHHHHDHEREEAGEGHRRSKWKYLPRMFDHRDRDRGKRDAAIDKSRKSTVNSVQRKHQVGHFHALVEGLMRHVKHSKKSKPAIHGRKKSQWGKTLKRRRGVKLPKKGRVKLGFTSKKPQLAGAS